MNLQELDGQILYDNALFFKREILPYFFVLQSNSGDIIIKTEESDFRHLVGCQYCKNLAIVQYKQKDFFAACLNKDISITELLKDDSLIYTEYLSTNQEKIKNKNDCFIELFKSLINSINLKLFSKETFIYMSLDLDYHHNKNSGDFLDILGITGHIFDDYFSYSSIIRSDDEKYKNKFTHSKPIKINKVIRKRKIEWEEYLKTLPHILKSPRNIENCSHTKQANTKQWMLNKQYITQTNNLLKNNLQIKVGKYGKKSVQLYKDNKEIEKKLVLPKEIFIPKNIADYINDRYGD